MVPEHILKVAILEILRNVQHADPEPLELSVLGSELLLVAQVRLNSELLGLEENVGIESRFVSHFGLKSDVCETSAIAVLVSVHFTEGYLPVDGEEPLYALFSCGYV